MRCCTMPTVARGRTATGRHSRWPGSRAPQHPRSWRSERSTTIWSAGKSERLRALYRGTLALALPSYHETFGMPMIEAMACGAPVLASHAGSLPEVGARAALYLPPHDRGRLGRSLAAHRRRCIVARPVARSPGSTERRISTGMRAPSATTRYFRCGAIAVKLLVACERVDAEGGTETYLRSLLPALVSRGYDVRVVARIVTQPEAYGVPAQAVEWSDEHDAPCADAADAVAAIAREFRPDVAVLHNVLDVGILDVIRRIAPRVVYHLHDHRPFCPNGDRLYPRGGHICKVAMGEPSPADGMRSSTGAPTGRVRARWP